MGPGGGDAGIRLLQHILKLAEGQGDDLVIAEVNRCLKGKSNRDEL